MNKILELAKPETGEQRLRQFKTILSGFPAGHLLDLGAGHGKFSILAHQLGWEVTAVDARPDRMKFNYKDIHWVVGNVRSFEITDQFTFIAILGLLYHMDDPIELLRRCTKFPTLIDTHFIYKVSDSLEGYGGEWDDEGDGLRSSFGNYFSFLFEHSELLRLLNSLWPTVTEYPHYLNGRTFFLCLP